MDYVRITFDGPTDNELTPAAREARARLQADINSAISIFLNSSRDSLIQIEVWPDDSAVAA